MSDPAQRAVDAKPKSAADWHRRGIALADDGKLDQAITAFRRALRLDDSLAEIHNDLGTAMFEKHWYAEAEASFRRAVELKPDHGIAHANLGAALRAQGRLREGRREYQRALLMKLRGLLPPFLRWKVGGHAATQSPVPSAKHHVLRAREFLNNDRLDEATQAAKQALEIDPDSVDALCVLSGAYRPTRPGLAEKAARRAVAIDAQSHAAHANLYASLWPLGRLEEAERHAREALRLAPDEPHYPLNLAILLKDAGRLDEAREIFHARRGSPPEHAIAMLNLGTLALECDGDLAAARAWFAKGLALKRDPNLGLSDSVVDLLDGRYDVAWPKYEARKDVPSYRVRHAPYAGFRPWDGKKLKAGRLLVYGEQGLGDEVMFASMVAELAPLAAQLTLMCDPRVEKLFRRSFPGVEVVPVKLGDVPVIANAPERVAAIGSLGLHFRRSAADFPQHRGYLTTDPEKNALWRERLAALGAGKKIGFSWAGGVSGTGRARRSLALEQLRPLLALPGVVPVSLQYGDCAAEIAAFNGKSGTTLHAFPGVADDMDDFASLIQALDTVVSVCNTTVHVAGAIGKEVLVMAPFLPEWRYGLRGEKMAWYPSARVFRQAAFGAWDEVISTVKAKLSGA